MLKNALVVVVLVGCGGRSKPAEAPQPIANQAEPAPVAAEETDAEHARRTAEAEAHAAIAAAEAAKAKVEALETSVLSLSARIDAAAEDMVNAESDEERARARKVLLALRDEQAAVKAAIAEAKAEATRLERANSAKQVPPECADHPTAKQCI